MIEKEVAHADYDKTIALIGSGQPIPFTGVFINPMRLPTAVTCYGNMRIVEMHTLDVFGYINRTPVVVRLEGWRPWFEMRLPIGVEFDSFLTLVNEEVNKAERRLQPDQKIQDYDVKDVTKVDGQMFEFGRRGRFIRFTAFNMTDLNRIKRAAEEAYHRACSIIDGLKYEKREGYSPPVTAWEKKRHRLDGGLYPLRFTKYLSDSYLGQQFMSENNLPLCGQLTINKYALFDPVEVAINRRVGLHVVWEYTAPPIVRRVTRDYKEDFFQNALCLAYDLETWMSRRKGGRGFCDPMDPKDHIMTIGAALYKIDSDVPALSFAIVPVDHRSKPMEKALTVVCKDEKDMIATFSRIMRNSMFAFFTGHNSDEFDNRYLRLRAKYHHIEEMIRDAFGDYIGHGNSKVKLVSNATFKMDGSFRNGLHHATTTMKGVADSRLRAIKKQPKEFQTAESLNVILRALDVRNPVSGKVMQKEEMPIDHMYDLWNENTLEGNHDVYWYCVVDAMASFLILKKISFFDDVFQMAATNTMPIVEAIHGADGAKVELSLTRCACKMNISFCNEVPPKDLRAEMIDEKIGGGDVKIFLPGKQGRIIALDFKSQYPAQKEGSGIGSSSKINPEMLHRPRAWGLVIARSEAMTDFYCSTIKEEWKTRARYWVFRDDCLPSFIQSWSEDLVDENGHLKVQPSVATLAAERKAGTVFLVEQFWAESQTKQWRTYYVQSRRDLKTGEFLDHFSIQAEMLDSLRSLRNDIRGDLKTVFSNKDKYEKQKAALNLAKAKGEPVDEKEMIKIDISISECKASSVILDMRQNSVKVIMNSEYGITNNEVFCTCDQDSAATVTWSARRLVEFLRRLLKCKTLYLPDFLVKAKEFASPIASLRKFGASVTEVAHGELKDDMWKDEEGYVMLNLRLLEEKYPITTWYKVTMPPASPVYQDTDSSYYLVLLIIAYFESHLGALERMQRYLLEYLLPYRLSLDEEERKKLKEKVAVTFGTSSSSDPTVMDDAEMKLIIETVASDIPDDVADPKARAKVVGDYWADYRTKRAASVLKGLTGKAEEEALSKYVVYSLNSVELLRERCIMWHLIDHNGLMAFILKNVVSRPPIEVACEGAFITAYFSPRKKQYMGIVAPTDKRALKKIDRNYLWPDFSDFDPMTQFAGNYIKTKNLKVTGLVIVRRETPPYIVQKLLRLCQEILCISGGKGGPEEAKKIIGETIEELKNISPDKLPMYAKQQKYRNGVANDVSTIVDRLKVEGKTDLIPSEFQAVKYVLVSNSDYTESAQARGKKDKGAKRGRYRLVQEMLVEKGKHQLDLFDYVSKLAKTFGTFVFEELIQEQLALERDAGSPKVSYYEELLDRYQKAVEMEERIERMNRVTAMDMARSKAMKKEKNAELTLMVETAKELLLRDFFIVGSQVKTVKELFRNTTSAYLSAVGSAPKARSVAKKVLDVIYDKTKPVGALVDMILLKERKMAMMPKAKVATFYDHYHGHLSRCRTEDDRKRWYALFSKKTGEDMITTTRQLVAAYGNLVSVLQKVDPSMTKFILDHRNSTKRIDFNGFVKEIPIRVQIDCSAAIQAVKPLVDKYRAAARADQCLKNACIDLGFKYM